MLSFLFFAMAPLRLLSEASQDSRWRHVEKSFQKVDDYFARGRTSDDVPFMDDCKKIYDLIEARRPWKVQQEMMAFGKHCQTAEERAKWKLMRSDVRKFLKTRRW